jgi:hypothetical protein
MAQADAALQECVAWVKEWGPTGQKLPDTADPESQWVITKDPDGKERYRRPESYRPKVAPPLPGRSIAALTAIGGSQKAGLLLLLDAAGDGEKYTRFRKSWQETWRESE